MTEQVHVLGSLTAHVLDSVLVSKPITALDSVIHVPAPVVTVAVAESSVDATLGSNRVASGGEELADASSLKTILGQTHSSTEASTTGSDDNSIVLMVNCKQ